MLYGPLVAGIVAQVRREQHRWSENAYVFQVGGVLFVALRLWRVFWVQECVELIRQAHEKIAVNVSFLLRWTAEA